MLNLKENELKKFKFALEIKGADLSKTQAKLIFEDKNSTKFFPVKISDKGVCEYQIDTLDIQPLSEGKVYLEVIAESLVFKPWEDSFKLTKTPTKPTVNITDSKTKVTTTLKSTPVIKNITYDDILKEYKSILKENNTSFFLGDTEENLLNKNIALKILNERHGVEAKNIIDKISNIKIDELILL